MCSQVPVCVLFYNKDTKYANKSAINQVASAGEGLESGGAKSQLSLGTLTIFMPSAKTKEQ